MLVKPTQVPGMLYENDSINYKRPGQSFGQKISNKQGKKDNNPDDVMNASELINR